VRRNSITIYINNGSDKPIYQQIVDQMKAAIMEAELPADGALPSLRNLARDLRISVITTKRAYEELERSGFIESVPGKGYYALLRDKEIMKEERLKEIEGHLSAAVDKAKRAGLSREELSALTDLLWEEE
jgi:GntR family transcriptional regulator